MTLAVEKSSSFQADVTGQFEWYFEKAGEEIAWRFFKSVDLTLHKLSRLPDLGRVRHFRNPLLHGMYSYRVEPPFEKF
ncbi:MAG TPA: hypothetical protein VH251_00740 [Verrucomicrobiae bacterium]|nr:hypothetical protein [Verrucomicrobiae bacterium]